MYHHLLTVKIVIKETNLYYMLYIVFQLTTHSHSLQQVNGI